MQLQGRNVLVVGLAASGAAVAEFLLEKGARVHVTDAKSETELQDAVDHLGRVSATLDSTLRATLGRHEERDFLDADLIVLSPGVPLSLPPLQKARQKGVPVIAEVELASRFLKGEIVAITGSNGKTTTTSLVGELFRSAGRACTVAGNIGPPLIGVVKDSRDDQTHVVELSSFQLESIDQFRPHVAALLNVTPDHLDRYPSMEAYFEAKRRVFMNQREDDFAVLNADDSWCARASEGLVARPFFFARSGHQLEGVSIEGSQIVVRKGKVTERVLELGDIPLKGSHNVENVMAAVGVGSLCGLDPDSMRRAVQKFRGVEHRLEFVTTIEGVSFFNDSKATNVDSAIKAIESFDGPLVPILGGKDKGSDYGPLRPALQRRCRAAVLLGAAADKIAAALQGAVPLQRARDMRHAVELGFATAHPGDTVILAPACASFDMFDNYEHRGRIFKEEVGRLAAGRAGRSS